MQCEEASGWRVLPCGPPAAPLRAWCENETKRTPRPPAAVDDGRRLLEPGSPRAFSPEDKRKKEFLPRSWREKISEVLRPPYFILTMVVVLAGVHWAGGEHARRLLEWSPGSWRCEPWRFVTYATVHAGATHLALNALVALAVGWWLENEQSTWRVAALWAGGVVAGALGAGALQPQVRVVGASAAVYALLTSHLSNICLRFGHVPLWWFRPLSVVVLSASEGCWALVGTDAPASFASLASRVAWSAHMTGALAGVPLGFVVFTGEHANGVAMRACRLTSLTVVTVALMAAVVHFARWPPDRMSEVPKRRTILALSLPKVSEVARSFCPAEPFCHLEEGITTEDVAACFIVCTCAPDGAVSHRARRRVTPPLRCVTGIGIFCFILTADCAAHNLAAA
ncbi:Protein rhomboid [Eumeta japonica]|uniref:Protein rhomboid n=1 Tax=Eumeta variegata TaxID=151549 RepID=A0A4C1V0L7_EUMVA|nr:Protein rhomboid [Eumeta japonica]